MAARTSDLPNRTVPAVVDRAAGLFGKSTFLKDSSGVLLTFESLRAASHVVGRCVVAAGLGADDRAVTMMANRQEYYEVWVGLLRGGVTEVAVNTANRGAILDHQLGVCAPRLIFADEAALSQLATIPRVASVELIVAMDSPGTAESHAVSREYRCVSYEQFLQSGAGLDQKPYPAISTRDTASILFTSGTTGPSKGVVLSHGQNIRTSETAIEMVGATADDVFLLTFPLFHASSRFVISLTALLVGAKVHLVDRMTVSRFWELTREAGATVFVYLGGLLPLLWKQPARADDADNPVLRAWGAGAPPSLVERFQRRFGIELIEMYGSTELGNVTFNRHGAGAIGSCGTPASHLDVAILDEHDELCPVHQVGEIAVRPREPDVIFDRYYGMPDETLHAIRNLWFHTGDQGYLGDDGHLHFAGRLTDSIRRRGENVSAWEVEREIVAHDDVLEVAAYPVFGDAHDEEVMVAVALHPGADLTPADLVAYCERVLPYYAVPRFVRIVDQLPKTASERVQKPALRSDGVTADTYDRVSSAVSRATTTSAGGQ